MQHPAAVSLSDREVEVSCVLAQANHILCSQGILDGFGHVSVRSPEDDQHFLLSRNLAPALVRPGDIQRFNLDGETSDPRRVYLERYIHAAIYRARPDVNSVVHSHSLSVLPYSAVSKPLRPVMHMASFLPLATPVFEMREKNGEKTDLLIRNNKQGDDLANKLASSSVSLMRGHGYVAVGHSVQHAVFNAIYTEKNAYVQAQTELLGEPTYLNSAEAHACTETNASQVGRAWDYWLDQVDDRPLMAH